MNTPASTFPNNPVQLPFRSKIASILYRRTATPFRVGFTCLAYLRNWKKSTCLLDQGQSDDYILAHTRNYFADQWHYSYGRVYDLLRHFLPPEPRLDLRVLSIGPRTEIELYFIWLFLGCSWKNIIGVDLVSATRKIVLGDMSLRLPFPDRSFDVIIASHCLEKSRNPEKTRDEIRRVARPMARVLVCGNRVAGDDGRPHFSESANPIPVRFFKDGVYGFMDLYELKLREVEYFDANSPHGFQIIFQLRT